MDYLIVNTSLMVKGKNYPEGTKISDSVLSQNDLKELSNFLKPIYKKGNSTRYFFYRIYPGVQRIKIPKKLNHNFLY